MTTPLTHRFLRYVLAFCAIAVPFHSSGQDVNVKDAAYGAMGDGKTDDTAAIRKAFAAVKPGGKIVFPAGTYKMDPTTNGVAATAWNFTPTGGPLYAGAILTADNVTIEGQGATILGSATTASTSDRCNAMFFIKGSSGAPVKRFTMQGMSFNLQNQSGSVALYAQWVRDITVKGNSVRNHASMIDAFSFDNTMNTLSEGNSFKEGGIAHGLYAAINTTIRGNTTENVRELLDADKAETAKGETQVGTNVVVTGNTYTRTTQDKTGDAAIEINGYSNVTISNNTIRNSNDGIRITSKPRNGRNYPAAKVSITGNTIEGVARTGIMLGDNATNHFVNHTDIVIEGNTIAGAGMNGIKLRGERITVKGNTVRDSGSIGIFAENIGHSQNLADFTISGNTVTGSGGDAIQLDRSGNGTVASNKIGVKAGAKSVHINNAPKVNVSGNTTN